MNGDIDNIQIMETHIEQNNHEQQLQIHKEPIEIEKSEITTVDLAILQERNTEIKKIAHDISIISEIFHTIQNMVLDQGLDLNVAYDHVERAEINTTEAKESLEKAEQYHTHSTRNIRDTSIVVTGLAIGGVGWIGGPWIGIPTTAVGVGISTGIVMLLRKIGV